MKAYRVAGQVALTSALLGVLLLLCAAVARPAQAATCTSNESGDWTNGDIWSCGHAPTAADDVTISNGHTVTISEGAGNQEVHSMTLSGTLVGNSYELHVKGDWSNSGTFNPGIGQVVFDGDTGARTISGTTTFYDLDLNKSNADFDFGSSFISIVGEFRATAGSMIANSSTFTFLGSDASLAGTNLKRFNHLVVANGASLSHTTGGNVDISGNFSNLGSFNSTKAVTFSGGGSHSMSGNGSTAFGTLTISGGGSVSLTNSPTVNNQLDLSNGTISLNSSTLSLGSGASANGGSSSKMVVTNGSGALCKQFAGAGGFTFPIGTTSSGAVYSPASVTFTGGSFSSGARVCARVTAAALPGNTGADKLNRYWTVSSSDINGFSAGVTFQYAQSDVSGTESNLVGVRHSGATWQFLDAVNTGNHTFSGTVSAFGEFTAGDSSLPVSLSYFEARPDRTGAVEFVWQTANEVGNAGWNIYGITASEERRRLNGQLIAAATPDSLAPRDYRLQLPGAAFAAYYLEEVDLLGRTRLHGPFQPGERYGAPARLDPIDWTAIGAEHASAQAVREARWLQEAQGRVELAREQVRGPMRNAPSNLRQVYLPAIAGSGAGVGLQRPLLDLRVRQTGIYRVTYEHLTAAGIDLAGVPAAQVALLTKGEPAPLWMHSGDLFGPGAWFEFYGEALDTLYSDTAVYQLLLDDQQALRIALDSRPPTGQGPGSHRETRTFERERTYSFAAPNGDPWYDTRLLAYTTPTTATFSLTAPDLVPGGPITLTVNLWGGTDWPGNGPDHHVVAAINGVELAEASFNGIAGQTIEAAVPPGLLHDGANTLALVLPGDTGVAWDAVMLDSYSVSYPRAFQATADRLRFSAMGASFTVSELSSADVAVYRAENNGPVRLSPVTDNGPDGTYLASFAGTNSEATYTVATAASLLTPEYNPARPVNDITSGSAQYLMIVHPDFLTGIEPLAQYHRGQGLDVKVVDVEDVYHQFSFGELDPEAIRAYIAYAAGNMATEMVLLVGGDSYDYRHYLGTSSISFVPSLYAATDPVLVKFAPVDPLYADVTGDQVPDLPIGRLPVRTSQELSTLIEKTLAFADKTYGETAVFAADRPNGAEAFSADSDALIEQMPPVWASERAYLGDLGIAGARAALLQQINQGVALTSFVGHSGLTYWSFDNLFTSADARTLSNSGRPTLVVQWGCWNNYHVAPEYNTLGHAWLLSGDRGAAVVLGAATLTRAYSDRRLGLEVTPLLVQPGMSVGNAVQQAKAAVAATEPELVDVLLGWTLLGDPALVVTP